MLFLNKNAFVILDHSTKAVSAQVAHQDACLAPVLLLVLDVLPPLLPTMMVHAVAQRVSISKLPPSDSANNALNIAQLALPPMPAHLAVLTSLLSMELALAQVEDLSATDNAFHVFLDVKHAQAPPHATFATLLFFFKLTLVLLDVDLASINLDSLATPALMDVLPALDPTSALSVNPESLPTTDSVMLTALQDQLPALTHPLVLLVTLLVLLALNTQANAQAATLVVDLSSISNASQAVQLDLTRSTELANTAHITVLLASEATLPVLHAQPQRFSSMEPAMINVHSL